MNGEPCAMARAVPRCDAPAGCDPRDDNKYVPASTRWGYQTPPGRPTVEEMRRKYGMERSGG